MMSLLPSLDSSDRLQSSYRANPGGADDDDSSSDRADSPPPPGAFAHATPRGRGGPGRGGDDGLDPRAPSSPQSPNGEDGGDVIIHMAPKGGKSRWGKRS